MMMITNSCFQLKGSFLMLKGKERLIQVPGDVFLRLLKVFRTWCRGQRSERVFSFILRHCGATYTYGSHLNWTTELSIRILAFITSNSHLKVVSTMCIQEVEYLSSAHLALACQILIFSGISPVLGSVQRTLDKRWCIWSL